MAENDASKAKRKKITAMTLEEVNKALENAQQHMGTGNYSDYARALINRRNLLKGSPK